MVVGSGHDSGMSILSIFCVSPCCIRTKRSVCQVCLRASCLWMLVISLALFFLPASRDRSIDNACSLILISLCLDTIDWSSCLTDLYWLEAVLVSVARVKSSPCSASLDWKIAVCGLPCLRAARLPTTMDFIARSWVSLVVNMGARRLRHCCSAESPP